MGCYFSARRDTIDHIANTEHNYNGFPRGLVLKPSNIWGCWEEVKRVMDQSSSGHCAGSPVSVSVALGAPWSVLTGLLQHKMRSTIYRQAIISKPQRVVFQSSDIRSFGSAVEVICTSLHMQPPVTLSHIWILTRWGWETQPNLDRLLQNCPPSRSWIFQHFTHRPLLCLQPPFHQSPTAGVFLPPAVMCFLLASYRCSQRSLKPDRRTHTLGCPTCLCSSKAALDVFKRQHERMRQIINPFILIGCKQFQLNCCCLNYGSLLHPVPWTEVCF